jgi:hypothetical protein
VAAVDAVPGELDVPVDVSAFAVSVPAMMPPATAPAATIPAARIRVVPDRRVMGGLSVDM